MSYRADSDCPGPHCLMCSGEACNLCGAGCWDGDPRDGSDPSRPICEHGTLERHADPMSGPPPTPNADEE